MMNTCAEDTHCDLARYAHCHVHMIGQEMRGINRRSDVLIAGGTRSLHIKGDEASMRISGAVEGLVGEGLP